MIDPDGCMIVIIEVVSIHGRTKWYLSLFIEFSTNQNTGILSIYTEDIIVKIASLNNGFLTINQADAIFILVFNSISPEGTLFFDVSLKVLGPIAELIILDKNPTMV